MMSFSSIPLEICERAANANRKPERLARIKGKPMPSMNNHFRRRDGFRAF